jgi:hypothetical protein
MDYIAISLFCKGLISRDQKTMWIYGVLREALARRWQVTKKRMEERGLIQVDRGGS